MDLTFVELFAGVGGMSRGLEMAGWKCVGHAEWEDFPRRVLKHRWPDIPLWGDVSQLNGREMVAQVGPFTMLTFGAPCQDFSMAGKRSGLDGERSVLVMDALRIWDESQAPFALYENVVGMLSSNNGADFAGILSVFVGDPVAVPKRGWKGGGGVVRGRRGVAAWRVLDAQYFGVPQRRRRVFVLGTRVPGVDPAEVLSLAESLSGHPSKSRKARETTASNSGVRLASESGQGFWDDSGLARLRAEGGGSPQNVVYFTDSSGGIGSKGHIMPTLRGFGHGWQGQQNDDYSVVQKESNQTEKSIGFSTTGSVGYVHDVMPTLPHKTGLGCTGAQMIGVLEGAHTFSTPAIGHIREDAVASAMTANTGGGGETQNPAFVIQTPILMRNREGKPGGGKGPLCSEGKRLTLGTSNDQVLFTHQQFGGYSEESMVNPTMQARDYKGATTLVVEEAQCATGTITHTLTRSAGKLASEDGTGRGVPVTPTFGIPRRLTPVECERLMGWPDGWTDVPDEKGKPAADTARYKACGNGVASPVAAWIGFQLREAIARLQPPLTES